jgi:hypothetical protein
MDVCLAGRLDGFEASQLIRSFDPFTPIIIMSAVGNPSWLSRARSVGANGFMAKPFTAEMIVKVLAKAEPPKGRRMSDPCVQDVEFFAACEMWPTSERLGPSFHSAIWNNDAVSAKSLLKLMPTLVDWSDPSIGNCPLHIAARLGNADLVQFLIDAKANVNKCSHKGYNALHVAAWADSVPCVELLLSAGCDINQKVPLYFLFCLLKLFPRVQGASLHMT